MDCNKNCTSICECECCTSKEPWEERFDEKYSILDGIRIFGGEDLVDIYDDEGSRKEIKSFIKDLLATQKKDLIEELKEWLKNKLWELEKLF